ncbi:MAG: hypothetical protein IT245_08930 [Bacteroidia bacterium]|nr:hypothetical protein [Bacteroidia bacterium]
MILPLGFETNDDIGMELAFSGYYSGQPEYGSLFTHYLFGQILQWLYQIKSSINWYGCLLLSLHFFASLLLIWKCIKSDDLKVSSFIIVIVILGAYINFVMRFNFATVAYFSGFAGLYYALDCTWSIKSKSLWLSFILMVCSICIRPHFFILASIFLLPHFFSKLWNREFIIIKKVGLIVIVFVVFKISNHIAYSQDKVWGSYYQKYNSMLHLLDNPTFNLYYFGPFIDWVEWTENDFQLFKNFYFELPSKMSLDKLTTISKNIPRDAMDFNEFYPALFHYVPISFMIALVAGCLFSFLYYGKRHLVINLVLLVFVLLFLQFLTGNKYIFKDRMIYSLYLGLLMNYFIPLGMHPKAQRLPSLPLIVLTLSMVSVIFKHVYSSNVLKKSLKQIENHLTQQYPNNFIFEFYCYYPNSGFKNWESSAIQMKQIKFLPMGWIMNTPLGAKHLERMGFSSLNQALLHQNTLHIIPIAFKKAYINLMQEYYKEYNCLKIQFQSIDTITTLEQDWLVLKINVLD